GHPIYHPIYRAAEELGLAIGIHIGSNGGMNPDSTAGGKVSLYAEMHPLWVQAIQTHATSFIMHGVFEKFPKLKLVLLEAGVSWVPGWLWHLDGDFKSLHREVPWLKRLPSEYFRDHISLTSQPMEVSPKRNQLIEMIEMFEGQKCLMFSTDFPHWDGDDVSFVASRLPREWWPDIFAGNAARLYGFTDVLEAIDAYAKADGAAR
ncbi:MAG TPA: amidohydrolase family protein, partial [Paenirhodobacter sp.]